MMKYLSQLLILCCLLGQAVNSFGLPLAFTSNPDSLASLRFKCCCTSNAKSSCCGNDWQCCSSIELPSDDLQQMQEKPMGRASKLSGWIRGTLVFTRPTACDTGTRAWGVMRGSTWFWGGRDWNSVFNTTLKPNDTTLDCGAHGRGWFAARSNHTGGANCAMVDGSVRFVTTQINSVLWQAAATRAGGEIGNLP